MGGLKCIVRFSCPSEFDFGRAGATSIALILHE